MASLFDPTGALRAYPHMFRDVSGFLYTEETPKRVVVFHKPTGTVGVMQDVSYIFPDLQHVGESCIEVVSCSYIMATHGHTNVWGAPLVDRFLPSTHVGISSFVKGIDGIHTVVPCVCQDGSAYEVGFMLFDPDTDMIHSSLRYGEGYFVTADHKTLIKPVTKCLTFTS